MHLSSCDELCALQKVPWTAWTYAHFHPQGRTCNAIVGLLPWLSSLSLLFKIVLKPLFKTHDNSPPKVTPTYFEPFYKPPFDQTHVARKGEVHYAVFDWMHAECYLESLSGSADMKELMASYNQAGSCYEFIRVPDAVGITAWVKLYDEIKPDLLIISHSLAVDYNPYSEELKIKRDAELEALMEKLRERLRNFDGGERLMTRQDTVTYLGSFCDIRPDPETLTIRLDDLGVVKRDGFEPPLEELVERIIVDSLENGVALCDDPRDGLQKLLDAIDFEIHVPVDNLVHEEGVDGIEDADQQ